mgnify:CR=1 FL=1
MPSATSKLPSLPNMAAFLRERGHFLTAYLGNNDLWLAAHAQTEGWILVTPNDREFARVPGLQWKNWVGTA